MKEQQRKQAGRKPLALILITALLIGILPVNQAAIKAAETSASVAGTSHAGYGLNSPSIDSDGVTTWDCVWFGNYWQEDTNGDGKADKSDAKTPIKWRVLSVNGDDAFLLADQNLDSQKYNEISTSVTWETCTMRSWLNGYDAGANVCETDYSADNFLDNAFNASEQAAIKNTTVVNEDNPYYGTEGGNITTDKVYLLSLGEVMNPSYGFTSTIDETDTRKAVNTAYVAAGGEIKSSAMYSAGRTDYWWLRSPGGSSISASNVLDSGNVGESGYSVHDSKDAVRPALHLNLGASSDALSTSSWSYADTVTSNGGETTTGTPVPAPTPSPTPSSSVPPASVTQNVTPQDGASQNVAPQNAASQTAESDGTVVSAKAPGKVTTLKIKAKKKAIQASWKKVSGASGYQIWYSTSKKFGKKSAKTTKKTKLTIKKLKSGKAYFVKVRAYTVRNGKKVYGAWSKAVKKKVK